MNIGNLPVYTVSNVTKHIQELLEGDGALRNILVRGEISNYSCSPAGHHYFSLKEEGVVLSCVMFKGNAFRGLRFKPVNGMQVVAFGRVTAYPRDGKYQLQCSELMEDGRGQQDKAFERMRQRLEQEGLFDPANKKPLPRYPKRVALVTSPIGKAVHDVLKNMKPRWPLTEVLVVPVRVQGVEAPEEIAAAIHRINNRADIDVIITGRGGGPKEDLSAFNEEVVARAIYLSNIPVISAVGHEPDVSIADYVADVCAATPTKAAIEVVPDQEAERARLTQLSGRLARALKGRLEVERRELNRLKNSRVMTNIKAPIQDKRLAVDDLRRRMSLALRSETERGRQMLNAQKGRLPLALKAKLTRKRGQFSRLAAGLEAMSPLKVLGRGYAIARKGENVVSSIQQTQPGDRLEVLVSDGVLNCEVKEKEVRTW